MSKSISKIHTIATSDTNKISDPYHLSGTLHVAGRSKFITEENVFKDLLYAKVLLSRFAHAYIKKIDINKALAVPGVIDVLTTKDIPGENQIGHTIKDEPLLPDKEVMYFGQPIAIVIAKDYQTANIALNQISVDYEELTPILTIEEAFAKKSFYVEPSKIERGNINKAFNKCDFILEDEILTSAQEHWYLETQRCIAVPGDHDITIYSATQSTAEVQEIAARILNIKSKDVIVEVKRIGGGFGGKERSATIWACLAALCAFKTKQPVEIKLTRLEDQTITGKRHPFRNRYKIGFNKKGKILAYELELASNGGAFADLSIPIVERAMFHADNAYYLPNVKITAYACKTNLPPNTAFRGFGAPQGIFTIESAIEKIAETLKIDAIKVREINFYIKGELTPYTQKVNEPSHHELLAKLKIATNYATLLKNVDAFNSKNNFLKRGIGVVPVKFGISFTASLLNQASSLIWIYTDGSVSVSHAGIEMGQEVNTKVAQVVSRVLGVDLNSIKIEASSSTRTGNASPTAASTGSDLNCNAAKTAAIELKTRLIPVAIELLKEKYNIKAKPKDLIFENNQVFNKQKPKTSLTFKEVVNKAYVNRIHLGECGYYRTPGIYYDRKKGKGKPFYYFIYGIALVVAEIDTLTGRSRLLNTHIIHELGRPLNREIDLGQIAGAFFQGLGYSTIEELVVDQKGHCLAVTPSTYKIPTICELPENFTIDIVERDLKETSIFGSKGIGEPPLIYGEAAFFAIRNAVKAANPKKLPPFKLPATPEWVLMNIKEP